MIRTCASISVQYDNIFAPFPGAEWAKGFQWAKDSGLDGVEIILSDPELLDVSAIRAKLDELELTVGTISTGQAMGMENIYMCAGSSLIRREARERLFRDIDFSAEVGKPNVTIGLIRGKGGLLPEKIELEHMLREMDAVANYAAQKGVILNLEPINRYECKMINSTADGDRLLEMLGYPENVGILYDTFHSNIEDADMFGAIERFGSHISHVHVADSNRRLPGEGHIDFARVYETLKKIGYDGYISLEVLNNPSAVHIIEHMADAMKTFRG